MSMPPLPKGLGNLGGAFDLGSLRQPAVSIDPDDLGYVVTQENLIAELLPASHDVVAILLCWSPRSGPGSAAGAQRVYTVLEPCSDSAERNGAATRDAPVGGTRASSTADHGRSLNTPPRRPDTRHSSNCAHQAVPQQAFGAPIRAANAWRTCLVQALDLVT